MPGDGDAGRRGVGSTLSDVAPCSRRRSICRRSRSAWGIPAAPRSQRPASVSLPSNPTAACAGRTATVHLAAGLDFTAHLGNSRLQVLTWHFPPASPSAPTIRSACPTASTSRCRSSTGISPKAAAPRSRSAPRGETVTYAELAERVNRAGNALLALGAQARRPPADGGQGLPGVLLCVLGRDQGRHRAGAAQHAAARQGLRLHDRGFRAAGAWSIRREFAAEVEPALAQVAGQGAARSTRLGDAWPRRPADARAAPRRRRPTTASGSIPRARPAGPRAPCTAIATWW